jgi:DinB family protein
MTSAQRNQLGDWQDELFRVEQEVRLALEPLSEAQFSWRPGPSRWSVGECLNHLAITTGLMLERVRPALERGREVGRTGGPPFKLGWVGGWFARLMEQPGKRPMAAPGNFVPPSDVPKPQVLAAFYAAQERFRNTMIAADGLALDRITAGSAAKGGGWIRLNLAAWFAATLAHQRRHVEQAKRVCETAGFPG